MYSIRLEYSRSKDTQFKDSITYCALIDLLVTHDIHCTQSSDSILTFESDRDRTLAVLILSDRSEYTPVCLD